MERGEIVWFIVLAMVFFVVAFTSYTLPVVIKHKKNMFIRSLGRWYIIYSYAWIQIASWPVFLEAIIHFLGSEYTETTGVRFLHHLNSRLPTCAVCAIVVRQMLIYKIFKQSAILRRPTHMKKFFYGVHGAICSMLLLTVPLGWEHILFNRSSKVGTTIVWSYILLTHFGLIFLFAIVSYKLVKKYMVAIQYCDFKTNVYMIVFFVMSLLAALVLLPFVHMYEDAGSKEYYNFLMLWRLLSYIVCYTVVYATFFVPLMVVKYKKIYTERDLSQIAYICAETDTSEIENFRETHMRDPPREAHIDNTISSTTP